MDAFERLIRKIDTSDDCWTWTGNRCRKGYGRIKIGGNQKQAHRVAYEFFVGPIPCGLTIDHLCRNRGCVRPNHLEPVTGRENTLRGVAPSAMNAVKTHCVNGHPFDEANTYWWGGGAWRSCRACMRIIAGKRYKARKS
jgi:hypothetical protein